MKKKQLRHAAARGRRCLWRGTQMVGVLSTAAKLRGSFTTHASPKNAEPRHRMCERGYYPSASPDLLDSC